MVKPPCCEKNKVAMKDGRFPEEAAYGAKQGASGWAAAPKKSGLRRCGKSCKIRWNGSQRPDQGDDNFTPEEEDLIIKLHSTIGSRWTIIAQQLPGRTDNDVKNLWNTKLKKKLSALGIDPVTHRPFSQILADYGNISGFPKARNRFGCLSRDMKNAFNIKPEQDHHPRPPPNSYFNCHFSSRNMNSSNNSELFMSNNDLNLSSAANQSMDLLSQLQAITMVTEASDYANSAQQMQTDCTYSSASSTSPESPPSATNNIQANAASPGFSWCDFLLEDAYAPTNAAQEHEAGIMIPQNEAEKEMNVPLKAIVDNASTISSGSFVDNMLEGENEMLSDFHGLLDDPFYY